MRRDVEVSNSIRFIWQNFSRLDCQLNEKTESGQLFTNVFAYTFGVVTDINSNLN